MFTERRFAERPKSWNISMRMGMYRYHDQPLFLVTVYSLLPAVCWRFFSENPEPCAEIGKLITRSDVRINPHGFRHHVAIMSRRGAEKSFWLILEKLLPMGATVVVFDPNSGYVRMAIDFIIVGGSAI